jgi:hypothetical protein
MDKPQPPFKGAILIPAASTARKCYRCPEMIYTVGKQPVSLARQPSKYNGTPTVEPTATTDGWGINHYADCPKAAEFRKK